jgi:hypothetical protein
MEIFDVRQFKTANHVVLSARCKVRRIGQDDLIFRIPAEFEQFVFRDASPFAAALLLPSMKLGQDLVIKGGLSARLYAGIQEIIKIVSGWDIGLEPIAIEAEELVADTADGGVTGMFFSGGVDSFYTYLRHKEDRDQRVTHLMLVNGYDIDPKNLALWDETARNIAAIARAEQVTLIEIESNVRSLIDPILSWDYTHGGCLAAAALCLRRGMRQTYIASSADAEHQALQGSHVTLDHLWSTEALAFVHDGWEASRMNKVDWIAKSPLALKYLRVCYRNEKGTYNCGKCEKCIRTMVSLYAAGVLDRAETFPSEIEPDRLAAVAIEGYAEAVFHRENLAALQERGLAPDLQQALQASLANVPESAKPRPIARRALGRIGYLDHSYALGTLHRIYTQVTRKSF